MTKRPLVEVYSQHKQGVLFDFRFRAANGRIVATSHGQGYADRYKAHRGLEAFCRTVGVDVNDLLVLDLP